MRISCAFVSATNRFAIVPTVISGASAHDGVTDLRQKRADGRNGMLRSGSSISSVRDVQGIDYSRD
jgi:hypothetical protein